MAELNLSRTKRKIDTLFLLHSIFAAFAGFVAYVFPHAYEWFMIHRGEKFALRDNSDHHAGEAKIEHLVIRIYGALIIAQAIITHHARKNESAPFRRSLVQAYFACFLLTTLGLLRAQITEGGHLNVFNWFNIAAFGALTAAYGWFSFFEKITSFEGLGKIAR